MGAAILVGAAKGAITGAVSGELGMLQFSMKSYHAGKAFFNLFSQMAANGIISMSTSLIKGDSYQQAMTAFGFGVIGGFIGAKFDIVKQGYWAKELMREGMIQFGLQFGEFGVNWINGEYSYAG